MYLLDTHVFFWWAAEPQRLSEPQALLLDHVEAAGESVALSAISLWDLAMLAHRGRIQPPKVIDLWLGEIESDPRIVILPLTGRIAAEAVGLVPEIPADPAERIIVATARCHGFPLLTADRRIRESGVVPVI